jgi:hypothetical protein
VIQSLDKLAEPQLLAARASAVLRGLESGEI